MLLWVDGKHSFKHVWIGVAHLTSKQTPQLGLSGPARPRRTSPLLAHLCAERSTSGWAFMCPATMASRHVSRQASPVQGRQGGGAGQESAMGEAMDLGGKRRALPSRVLENRRQLQQGRPVPKESLVLWAGRRGHRGCQALPADSGHPAWGCQAGMCGSRASPCALQPHFSAPISFMPRQSLTSHHFSYHCRHGRGQGRSGGRSAAPAAKAPRSAQRSAAARELRLLLRKKIRKRHLKVRAGCGGACTLASPAKLPWLPAGPAARPHLHRPRLVAAPHFSPAVPIPMRPNLLPRAPLPIACERKWQQQAAG